MGELTAEKITKSVKEGKKDPRLTKDLEFQQDSRDPELLKKLRAGIDYWHMLPVGDTEIPVRLLSIKEVIDVMKETQQYFNDIPETQRVPGIGHKMHAVFTFLKALNSTPDDKDGHKYFVSKETLMALEDHIFVSLFRSYADLCEKYDISMDEVTDSEYKSIVEDLKKNPVLLKNLSRSRLEQTLLRLLQDNTSLMDSFTTALSQDSTTMK